MKKRKIIQLKLDAPVIKAIEEQEVTAPQFYLWKMLSASRKKKKHGRARPTTQTGSLRRQGQGQ